MLVLNIGICLKLTATTKNRIGITITELIFFRTTNPIFVTFSLKCRLFLDEGTSVEMFIKIFA